MAIALINNGDTSTRAKMNAAIEKANQVDSKASAAALQTEVTDRQSSDAAESAARVAGDIAEANARQQAIADEAAARIAAVANETAARVEAVASLDAIKATRAETLDRQLAPGEAPMLWTGNLDASTAPALDGGLVANDSGGPVIRASAPLTVAPRGYRLLEPGRTYRARFAVRRRQNSPDPADDAVRFGLRWYSSGKAPIVGGTFVLSDITDLTTADGRRIASVVFSDVLAPFVETVWPQAARFVRPFVQIFGVQAVTDVEVIDLVDVTDYSIWAPDVASFNARLLAQETLNLGARIAALESQVGVTAVRTFSFRAELEMAMGLSDVHTVHVLWGAANGDGLGGQFAKTVGGGDLQSPEGYYWTRVNPLSRPASEPVARAGVDNNDTMTAVRVRQAVESQLAGLPTAQPVQPNVLWLNGGVVCVSSG